MAAPTTWWICDSCGQRIECVEQGFVEWLRRWDVNHRPECRGIRIVHDYYNSPGGNGSCMYPANEMMSLGWNHLTCRLKEWRGQNGAKELRTLIRDGLVQGEESWEIHRRINVNGYEKARRYFDPAIAQGVIPRRADNRYTTNEIDDVLCRFDQS